MCAQKFDFLRSRQPWSRAGCLLLAALAVLPASAGEVRHRPNRSREVAIAKLALWVAYNGTDRDVDRYDAGMMGLKTLPDVPIVPMRTVALDSAQSLDGRARALSLAYNSNGKTMRPVAFVFWRIDVSSHLPMGTYTEGRTFLAKLSGELLRVVDVKYQPAEHGGRPVSVPIPVPVDSPTSAAGFREELSFWLAESAKPKAARRGR